MGKAIIWTEDGILKITHLAEGADPERARRILPDGVDFTVVDADPVPTDRTFRAAWTEYPVNGVPAVDMNVARDVWRTRIRAARAPRLAALDIEYQRADERDDDAAKQAVVAKKQVLRDATDDPRIEAAATIEELTAAWPEGL
jgi:hypothetical protein